MLHTGASPGRRMDDYEYRVDDLMIALGLPLPPLEAAGAPGPVLSRMDLLDDATWLAMRTASRARARILPLASYRFRYAETAGLEGESDTYPMRL